MGKRHQRGYRRRRFTACAALTATLVITDAMPAFAFHKYSLGVDHTHPGHYTYLQSQRIDKAMTGLNNTGCTGYFGGQPVYQSEWMVINPGLDWLELGTGHSCKDQNRYWYWGYGSGGYWFPIGEVPNVVNGDSHYFRIKRTGGENWEFYVDGTRRGVYNWAAAGHEVHAGLESYDGSATVIAYDLTALQFSLDEAAPVNWGGMDTPAVDPPEMCGRYLTGSSWRAAENASCYEN